MSLLIPGTNSIKDTGYDVANSCRFDANSTDSLSRTPSSAGNQKTFTISVWFKVSKLTFTDSGSGTSRLIIGQHASNYFRIMLEGGNNGTLRCYDDNGGFSFRTNRLFRDVSAWYHLVLAMDTTQSTESDRAKLYINGVQETSLSTATYPSQNNDLNFNNTSIHSIGRSTSYGGYDYYDGYMTEIVFIDGQQLDATSFGKFDSATSNVWVPTDVSGLTFGTNGFYLDFENASNLGADVSGNSNNFTVNNLTSVDQSTDTCTNNGCTLNILASDTTPIFTNGNLTINGNGNNSSNEGCPATFVLSRGKWYWEMKNESSNHANYIIPGFMDAEFYANLVSASGLPGNYYDANNGFTNNVQGGGDNNNFSIHRAGSSNATSSGGLLQNQVLSFALDLDNRKCWFAREGTYYNSGDPAAGSNETWSTSDIVAGKSYTPVVFHYYTGSQGSFNFGSPAFSISSGNSDANGYGNFEYAVPSGFYAINSKNLAEFG